MPVNQIQRVSIWTLAGVEKVKLIGDEIVGRFTDNPEPFRDCKNHLLFEEYANWPNDSQGIMHFTTRYGPVEESARPHGDFHFPLRRWQFWQNTLRKNWEHLMLRPHVYATTGFFVGVAGDRGWNYDPKEGLRYRAVNLWEYFCLSLMACPIERLKKCARPECPHPYFVARHPRQSYCSEQCARWAQQRWKRRWWHEHGKKRRDRKQSKTSRNPRKRKFDSIR
jgi:hypothetical protein